MAVQFDGSTQYLTTTLIPVTTFPFTVGMWFYMDAVSTLAQNLFAITDTGSADNMMIGGVNSSEQFRIAAQQSAGGLNTNAGPTVVAAGWNYGVWRFINATNYRAHVRLASGTTGNSTVTTSTTPTGLDTMTLGARQPSTGADFFWGGRIAEFFIANGDIYRSTGSTMDQALITHLSFNGPLKTPFLADQLVHYRSFRTHPSLKCAGDLDRGIAQIEWTNTGGATLNAHPV